MTQPERISTPKSEYQNFLIPLLMSFVLISLPMDALASGCKKDWFTVDVNEDGLVDRDEFESAYSHLDENSVNYTFAVFDSDGNGVFDIIEYSQLEVPGQCIQF